MYYDIYNSKMIPAIFIYMDNKTMEGYIFVFQYIKYYIHKILRNKKIKIKWDTITTDKGLSLYTSFISLFDEDFCKYKHILCYFHYMDKTRKYLQSIGYTYNKKSQIMNEFLITKNLPFKANNTKNISKYFSVFKKKIKI